MQKIDNLNKFKPSLELFQSEVDISILANAISYAEVPLRKYFSGIECVQGYLVVPRMQSRKLYSSEEIIAIKRCFPIRENSGIRGITQTRLERFPNLKNSDSLDRKKQIIKEMFEGMRDGEFLPFFFSNEFDGYLKRRIERFKYIMSVLESDIVARRLFAFDSNGVRLVRDGGTVDLRQSAPIYISKEDAWECLNHWRVSKWWDRFLEKFPDAEFDKITWSSFEIDPYQNNNSPTEIHAYAESLIHERIDRILDGDESYHSRVGTSSIDVVVEVVECASGNSNEKLGNHVVERASFFNSENTVISNSTADSVGMEESSTSDGLDAAKPTASHKNPHMGVYLDIPDDALWNIMQIAENLRISESQAWNVVSSKLCSLPFPQKIPKLGRHSVWRKADVLEWHQQFVKIKQKNEDQ